MVSYPPCKIGRSVFSMREIKIIFVVYTEYLHKIQIPTTPFHMNVACSVRLTSSLDKKPLIHPGKINEPGPVPLSHETSDHKMS